MISLHWRHSLFALALTVVSTSVSAQAWLPRSGSIDYAIVYRDQLAREHGVRAHSMSFNLAWGLTERVTIEAGIPWVTSRYYGDHPHQLPDHAEHTEFLDNGHYHDAFTDYRVSLHVQALDGPVAVAPFVAYSAPATRYESFGHSAPGRGLWETRVGSFAGASLDPWIPRTYVQARYSYSFVEKVEGVSHDRSNADLEVGWFATPRVALRTVLSWQKTHGGIPVPTPISNPLFHYHDQLGAEGYFNVGAGASLQLSRSVGVFALYETGIWSENGAMLDQGLSIGVSQRFTLPGRRASH